MKNSSTARRPFGITVIALILFVQALFEIVNIVLHFLGYEQTHTIFASMSGGILSNHRAVNGMIRPKAALLC